MSVIARLIASLTADTGSFEQGMKRASKELLSFGNIGKAVFEGEIWKSAFDKMAEGLKELTFGQVEAIDMTAKQARSLGELVSAYQAQSEVARDAGVDQDAFARAVTQSQKALFAAAEGSKQASAAFAMLHLDVKELLALSPDQQFARIAEALSKIQNPTERTALALQVFGKNGRAIIPMLDDFKNKLDEAAAFQKKFNIALSQTDARKVEEAKLTFDHVKEAVSGLGSTIAVYFAPLVTELGKSLLDAGVDGTSFSGAIVGAMNVAGMAIDAVRKTVLGMGTMFLEFMRWMDNLNASIAEKLAFTARIAEQLPFVGGKFAGLGDKLDARAAALRKDAAEETLGIKEADNAAEDFVGTMDKVTQLQGEAAQRAQEAEAHWQGLGNTANSALDGATAGVHKLNDALDNTDAMADKIDKSLGTAFDAVLKDAWNGTLTLKKLGDEVINVISQVMQSQSFGGGFGGGFGSMFSGLFSGVGNFFSGIWNSLPSFDVGTNYVPQDMVAKIHKGERIVPASQNNGGGGGVNLSVQVVNNHPGAQVTARQSPGPSGPQLLVMVDDAVSKVLSDPRSKSRQTLRSTHGVGPLLTGR